MAPGTIRSVGSAAAMIFSAGNWRRSLASVHNELGLSSPMRESIGNTPKGEVQYAESAAGALVNSTHIVQDTVCEFDTDQPLSFWGASHRIISSCTESRRFGSGLLQASCKEKAVKED